MPNTLKAYRPPWNKDFPDTIIDRMLGEATGHLLYEQAKSGDVASAFALATELITDDAVHKLSLLINNRQVVILPVHAEEAVGRNKIPSAVAVVLAKKLKLTVNTDIIQATKVSRTDKGSWYRLANPPVFEGHIEQNALALLVDDTQTQGGTFASLRGHVEKQGAHVIGAYALTGKQYSVQLKRSANTLQRLKDDYGNIADWWQKEFSYGFEGLTE